MATIIFDIVQATGHLNPSFKLAKMFQKRGHKVIYISSEGCEARIRLQGFGAYDIYQLHISAFQASQEVARRKSFALLKSLIKNSVGRLLKKYLKNLSVYMIERRFVMDRIRRVIDLQPDLIVVDSMLPLYRAILYYAYDINVVMLQTMMSTTQEPTLPPLHSRIVPSYSQMSSRLSKLDWYKYYIKRWFRKNWRKLIYLNSDPYTLSTRIMNKCGVTGDQLDQRRVINSGLKGLYEINLAPKDLDFPRSYRNYEVSAGYAVDIDRFESPLDDKTEKLLRDKDRPLIYCSLGTISTIHNRNVAYLLRKVIRAVERQPWHILLSIGSAIDVKKLGNIPPNVRIHSTLPQIKILKYADVMITHGGLNSIVECILHEVPMIICPLNNMWDQNGNAARVSYHKIGIRSRLHHEHPKALGKKIIQVLESRSIKDNIAQMKGKILANDRHEEVVNMIEKEMINDQKLAA